MVFKKQMMIMLTLFPISVFLTPIAPADDRARDRAALRGIQTVIVKVHSWEPEWRAELKKAGLEENIKQNQSGRLL